MQCAYDFILYVCVCVCIAIYHILEVATLVDIKITWISLFSFIYVILQLTSFSVVLLMPVL